MRKLVITLGAVVLAWAVLAAALGSPSLRLAGGSKSPSPSCLPGGETTATLPGTGVYVSPAPGALTANPRSQISFLGVAPGGLRDVAVAGERSGRHRGRVLAYSQGDGASFLPDAPFQTGERVDVSALVGAGASARRIAFAFRVDTPYSTAKTKLFPNPQAAPADYQSFYTLPGARVPILTVTTADRDPAAGDIFTTNGPGPGQYGPLIYTPSGRLVWFQRLTGGQTAEDLSVQAYAGRRVLTWWKGRVLELGFGEGEDIVMDPRYRTIARVPGANGLKADLHDFRIAPNGVAYITAYNPIHCDLAAAGGARRATIVDTAVQEIDMKTGLVRWEWHSLDHIGAAESEVETPKGDAPWDYFHLNSIDLLPGGNLLISARSTWAAYQLQRGTGKVLWRLGGNKSSFRMGPGTKLAWQHDGRALPGGDLTFFDNGSNPPIHSQSRAVRIRIDARSRQARLVSVFAHRDPPLLAPSQGNVQTLASGNTVVGYGGVPAISEYAPGGSLLFDAHQPLDMSFYRALRFPWSARPAWRPAVVATLNDTGEETIVHAGWNGATGVVRWRLLAGQRRGALTAQAEIGSSGFESSATLPRKHAYVAVQALDSAGRVIGTSAPVKVISFAASLPR
jgi:arylsulfotransferase ASST